MRKVQYLKTGSMRKILEQLAEFNIAVAISLNPITWGFSYEKIEPWPVVGAGPGYTVVAGPLSICVELPHAPPKD